jgi:hypothetical protein
MNVFELIEVLKKYPPRAPVVALWDGGWSNLDKHCVQDDENGLVVVEFDVTEHGTYDALVLKK